MEADINQQKVHSQETIQALLLVYNRPSLTRSQVATGHTIFVSVESNRHQLNNIKSFAVQ